MMLDTFRFFALLLLMSISFSGIAKTSQEFPGGKHTSNKTLSRSSFLHPSPILSIEEKMNFKIGQAIFEKIWVFAPASTTASDGLGPLYNARSCSRCHTRNGRGMIESGNSSSPALFLRLSLEPETPSQTQKELIKTIGFIPEPMYGKQLQTFSYPGSKAEAKLETRYTKNIVNLTDGTTVTLHTPRYTMRDQGYGAPSPDVKTSPRIAPPMIGLGLLEAIDEQDILSWADPDDSDHNGISGKANQVWDAVEQTTTLGRFGWKAGNPTLDQQNNAAFNGDIGISSWMFPAHAGDCTSKQTDCLKQIHGNRARTGEDVDKPEVPKSLTDAVLLYTRYLAVPKRRFKNRKQINMGEQVFHQAGCQQCHRPSFITGNHHEREDLRAQSIWPYSDLLLHDMGEGLADNRNEFEANGREWRTPPLWGLGLTKLVGGGEFYLHDGRARSILEAILWHGGEAHNSALFVKNSSAESRAALIAFLESL